MTPFFILFTLCSCNATEQESNPEQHTRSEQSQISSDNKSNDHGENSEAKSFSVDAQTLAEGLDHPWGMAILPDNSGILITEKYGIIRLFKDNKLIPIQGTPTSFAEGEAGLLDIVIDPNFADNNKIYLSYVDGTRAKNNMILYTALLNKDKLVDGKILYQSTHNNSGSGHTASRLLFIEDDVILMSVGDGFEQSAQAQANNNILGKTIRVRSDGTPMSSAFKNAINGLFTKGHRNIEGLAYDKKTKHIWATEHGPKGGDELNLIEAGNNYGWPKTTYGVASDGSQISSLQTAAGITDPIETWIPSIAPSGLAIYYGEKFKEWQGNILAGALAGRQLRRMKVENGQVILQEVLLQHLESRIRDVKVSSKGEIYILTDGTNGKLRQLTKKY